MGSRWIENSTENPIENPTETSHIWTFSEAGGRWVVGGLRILLGWKKGQLSGLEAGSLRICIFSPELKYVVCLPQYV